MTQTPRTGLRLPVVRALAPRDPDDAHRVASPLELLTDLCFVVAITQAALGLLTIGPDRRVARPRRRGAGVV